MKLFSLPSYQTLWLNLVTFFNKWLCRFVNYLNLTLSWNTFGALQSAQIRGLYSILELTKQESEMASIKLGINPSLKKIFTKEGLSSLKHLMLIWLQAAVSRFIDFNEFLNNFFLFYHLYLDLTVLILDTKVKVKEVYETRLTSN